MSKINQETEEIPTTEDKILGIQEIVLDLLDKIYVFEGTRSSKEFLYYEELLIRNLINLDNIEAKNDEEDIKKARREGIKSINKCSAMLETIADFNAVLYKAKAQQQIQVSQQSSNAQEYSPAQQPHIDPTPTDPVTVVPPVNLPSLMDTSDGSNELENTGAPKAKAFAHSDNTDQSHHTPNQLQSNEWEVTSM